VSLWLAPGHRHLICLHAGHSVTSHAVMQECQQSAVNEPTWTGRSGGGGLASSRPRFGTAVNPRLAAPSAADASTSAGLGNLVGTTGGQAPSSSQLLARMHNRQQGMNQEAAAGMEPEVAQRITKDLVNYLDERGGSAPSAEIINHFRHVGERHAALFRQLLKHLATLQRTADGSKLWTLKPEFVPDS
jgi:hypothetical protein